MSFWFCMLSVSYTHLDLFSEGCGFTDDSVMTIAVGEALLVVGPEAAVKELSLIHI